MVEGGWLKDEKTPEDSPHDRLLGVSRIKEPQDAVGDGKRSTGLFAPVSMNLQIQFCQGQT
jgi:hypothetical protein